MNTFCNYSYEHLVKISLYGDAGVGKTTLVQRFVSDEFKSDLRPTLGLEFSTRLVILDDTPIKVQLFDASGAERFHQILRHFARGYQVILFLYDVTNIASFENIKYWHHLITKGIEDTEYDVMLVGTKCDEPSQRKVAFRSAFELAQELNIQHYMEVCAKTGRNVEEVFITGIAQFLRHFGKNK